MEFGNLKTDQGLQNLNEFLRHNSYIAGYTPTPADSEIFDKLLGCPNVSKYPCSARWYETIASYPSAERKAFGSFRCRNASCECDVCVCIVCACNAKKTCAGPCESKQLGGKVCGGKPCGGKPCGEVCAGKAADNKQDKKADKGDDLFGDDDDDDEEDAAALQKAMKARKEAAAAKAKEEEAKTGKKAKKPVIAKSSITFEAMPEDPDNPIVNLFDEVISKMVIDGVVWAQQSGVVNGPFGLKGLQFSCVIEDDKVKTDDLEEQIETIGLSEEDRKKYIEMRNSGLLDDYDGDWVGKRISSLRILSFQKL